MTLDAPREGSLSLVGGVLALDFANTSSGRGTAAHVEHLRRAEDVLVWARHAGLVPPHARNGASTGESLLDAALMLRDAVYGIGSRLAHRLEPLGADLRVVRNAASTALGRSCIVGGPGGYLPAFSHGTMLDGVLGPIAWSALELLRAGRFERLKQCPGEDCGWLFFDRSKNNTRVWCDMAVCGNRSKSRAYRLRSAP